MLGDQIAQDSVGGRCLPCKVAWVFENSIASFQVLEVVFLDGFYHHFVLSVMPEAVVKRVAFLNMVC